MRANATWSDTVQDTSATPQPIYAVTFTVDGTKLVAGAGAEVLVYNAVEGNLIKSLKGHKDAVISLAPLLNGGFASGGADKQVVIWSSQMDGVLKYTHNDTIQSLNTNPASGVLLSCTGSDYGIWSPDVKNVPKTKVPARICSSSWTRDGLHFALGLYNGLVLIRSTTGEEKCKIQRESPIFALSFSKQIENPGEDVLAITDWNQRFGLFTMTGMQLGKDRRVPYDAMTMQHYKNGQYILMGGSDKKLNLYNAEGIKIGPVSERNGWIWSCAVNPTKDMIAVGANDGTVSVVQVEFETVHGLYGDRYAYRSNMTEVVIQDLVSEQQARIKCRDYIKKIAVYKDRLAVQLPERLVVYELFHDENGDMHYRIKDKINKNFDCNLLVVASQHVLLCHDKKLQLFNFFGEKEREWSLDNVIRYLKVIGGPKAREGLLVGLKDGSILKIFVDSPFPIPILKHQFPIRCIDLNLDRKLLAVVDEQQTCTVYDIKTQEILYQEPNADAVAWNLEVSSMLCYSGNSQINIKVGDFPAFQQNGHGLVVGVRGSKILCLDGMSMLTYDIPVAVSMERYLQKGNYEKAYEMACLGVPELDWKKLGLDALEHLSFDVAKRSFIRIKEYVYLEGIRQLEKGKNDFKFDHDSIMAEVNTLSGNYQEAARYWKKSGQIEKAINMFTELNMWEQATQLASETNATTEAILLKKAQMQEDRKDILAAAQTYEQVGDYAQAVQLLGPPGYVDKLIEIVRKISDEETKILEKCVYFFRKHANHVFALETLKKLKDIPNLLKLMMELNQWEEAFKVVDLSPQYSGMVHLPYGNWLAAHDRFVEAQEHYVKAGRPDEAVRVLKRLSANSVFQRCYDDAAYYYFCLSKEILSMLPPDKLEHELEDQEHLLLQDYKTFSDYADIYHAYAEIYRFVEDPFTFASSGLLLGASKTVLHKSSKYPDIQGISKSYCWYTMAKIARNMQANKLSRYAFEKLLQLHLPSKWENTIELSALMMRAKPNTDKPEHVVQCPQCHTENPLFNPKAEQCLNCLEPFVLSRHSFEALPLIQFVPEQDISEREAMHLISVEPKGHKEDALSLELTLAERSRTGYKPLVLGREDLLELNPYHVFVKNYPVQCVPSVYYKLTDPQARIVMCDTCQSFFQEDEWTTIMVSTKKCEFCRSH
ncbi:WD40-repeat-containing domain protein [Gorgonomyces haynaldii]|nr:WD40-repeat-containing domain protein [Gorgonomyces haynaldii]